MDAVGKVKTSPTQKGPICVKVGVIAGVKFNVKNCIVKQPLPLDSSSRRAQIV